MAVIENYIVQIIREEMSIPQAQIWVSSQNKKIDTASDKLFVIVGLADARAVSSKSSFNPDTQKETQEVLLRGVVQVDIMSRDNKARDRRAEILMALNSFRSQNKQDSLGFRIFEIPSSFKNTSSVEGGSEINRFTIQVPVMFTETKIQTTDYYDQFSGSLTTETGTTEPFPPSEDNT